MQYVQVVKIRQIKTAAAIMLEKKENKGYNKRWHGYRLNNKERYCSKWRNACIFSASSRVNNDKAVYF